MPHPLLVVGAALALMSVYTRLLNSGYIIFSTRTQATKGLLSRARAQTNRETTQGEEVVSMSAIVAEELLPSRYVSKAPDFQCYAGDGECYLDGSEVDRHCILFRRPHRG